MSFRVLLLSATLTALLSLNLPSCHAYSYAILSQTLPQRSYYIETFLTSPQLSPLASGLSLTSNAQIVVNASVTNDLTVNTQGTGLFAIVYRDNPQDSYCVIRILDAKSTTIQQSGLACTIAPSVSSARIQAEPSTATCGGANPCKQSVVAKLDMDTAANNNLQQTQESDNMGASSTTIIVASVSGAVGLVAFIIIVAMVCHSRRQRYTPMKDAATKPATTTSVMWATPPAVVAASTEPRGRGESTHVRTQTELNYAVNPMQYNVAVDIHEPGLQLSSPIQRYH